MLSLVLTALTIVPLEAVHGVPAGAVVSATQPVSPVVVVVFETSVVTDEVRPRVRPNTP